MLYLHGNDDLFFVCVFEFNPRVGNPYLCNTLSYKYLLLSFHFSEFHLNLGTHYEKCINNIELKKKISIYKGCTKSKHLPSDWNKNLRVGNRLILIEFFIIFLIILLWKENRVWTEKYDITYTQSIFWCTYLIVLIMRNRMNFPIKCKKMWSKYNYDMTWITDKQ